MGCFCLSNFSSYFNNNLQTTLFKFSLSLSRAFSLWLSSPSCVNFCKTSMDFSLPVLCLAPLFEFRGCSSTDCGLEWSGFEELSLCYPHPVFDPQVITAPPPSTSAPSFLSPQTGVPVVGTEKEVAGGHRPRGGWQPLPVEWRYWEPANHGWAFFTWY